MLTEAQAIEIYKLKLSFQSDHAASHFDPRVRSLLMRGRSNPLSERFGVSPRTIRDIWNRKTWAYATKSVWSQEAEPQAPSKRPTHSTQQVRPPLHPPRKYTRAIQRAHTLAPQN
jgi:hypothetical protein